MPAKTESKAPWELDPTERGIPDNSDITEHLKQKAKCDTCRYLGRNAFLCAAELRLPGIRTHTMLMRTCEQAVAIGGKIPGHGARTSAA